MGFQGYSCRGGVGGAGMNGTSILARKLVGKIYALNEKNVFSAQVF
jgi:hypothetical protein